MRIEFDRGPGGRGAVFDGAREIVRAERPEQVEAAFARLAAAQSGGAWLAGYFTYELGYCFEPRLLPCLPRERHWPLLEVGLYDAPGGPVRRRAAAHGGTSLRPAWSADDYARAFDRVARYIRAGDIYQANLTFPLSLATALSPRALYDRLAARQPVGHGVLIECGNGDAILSRSPELFYETDGQGGISVRPMKGTVPRGRTEADDRAARDWLAASEKNQAENLMIVDLLRNDLSRISEVGSVKVPDLFTIETYATVHQMTSTVTARLLPGLRLGDIFRALFPCGSITGAPKIRAMQILRDLEAGPRGVYCGSIGWAAPDGRSEFNVAIRTLEKAGEILRLHVGGGVVYDSDARGEYDEALLKARFAELEEGGHG
ncbi:aminodeoxychorismate synthase component I [Celeribacter indicus]|uniref:Aminodeoxychorismate synthase n=1 Tax=Celeribacter indicus TaxID=1208324 RepID=A0A0B5E0G3_9RHOB|nr:aminodeoxychorismate synthase component I [Celeribacter indicus]AJE45957.1 aminodeoxychorismate synthase [Celeribacter indicus]SDW64721.1 aminodeoxychorismate synthase, subunit I [Celeribacter indicus]